MNPQLLPVADIRCDGESTYDMILRTIYLYDVGSKQELAQTFENICRVQGKERGGAFRQICKFAQDGTHPWYVPIIDRAWSSVSGLLLLEYAVFWRFGS